MAQGWRLAPKKLRKACAKDKLRNGTSEDTCAKDEPKTFHGFALSVPWGMSGGFLYSKGKDNE